MTSLDEPLVSVIVPAWNAEATLWATLRSVSAQSYRNLEIIVVDDGSTDSTADVAARFCASDSRASLIRKENGGVASARNRGIAVARGEWLAPIDADDLWHSTKIAKQLAIVLGAQEKPGFVYCWYRFVDEEGRVIGSGPSVSIDGPAFGRLAYFNPVENGSALLVKRDWVIEAGGYDESLRSAGAQGCEDVMLQLRIALQHKIACVPEYLVGWRKHANNMSCDIDQIVRSARLVYQRLASKARRSRPRSCAGSGREMRSTGPSSGPERGGPLPH